MNTPSMTASALLARRFGTALPAVTAVSLIACSPPPPRTYDFFVEDSIARDGTIARCDKDPAASTDIECSNARRAAMAIQLRAERESRERLERESAAKIAALRREFEAQREAARQAEAAAAAAAAAAQPDPEAEAEPAVLELPPADASGGQLLPTVAGAGQAAGIVSSSGPAEPPGTAAGAAALAQPDGVSQTLPAGVAQPVPDGGVPEPAQSLPGDSPISGTGPSGGAGEDSAAAGTGLGIPRPFQPDASQPGTAESGAGSSDR